MYGVKVEKLKNEIEKITCPAQLHYGDNDNHDPIDAIGAVRGWLVGRARHGDEFYTYPEAEHAFYNRFRTDRFNEPAHQLAGAGVLRFLDANLASTPA
ncbi:hypothetical protein AC244_27275 [Ensifer adhaerens]|uniref:Dienelactone hydrolase domain-containing protein n=1 Tax=Ensifer adhaerens TaxID=106592 RepID=A0A0L8BI52_ENSAD|nr:dienelactone hydrolase family protein [Ensifer adhaerens]KOF14347.1 hypothetical protein AC244_27275 [Ensifer adhaerens]